MNHLLKIARSAAPGSGIVCRRQPYGPDGLRSFLRDVLSLANAAANGPRYIVVGVDFDDSGRRRIEAVDAADFGGKPDYTALAAEYIEPSLPLRYAQVNLDGKRVGVFEIDDARDRPYMMRIDFCERLRRGDAYQRIGAANVKLGRRQLAELFEARFQESVAATDIEIGFPGEILHKQTSIPVFDTSALPSAAASQKLDQLIDIRRRAQSSGSTTMLARLTHARLFGADDPYVHRSDDELQLEKEALQRTFRDRDEHFLFVQHGSSLQVAIANRGEEPIRDAVLSLRLPRHRHFHIATSLPKIRRRGQFVPPPDDVAAAYPSVTAGGSAVKIVHKIGDIPPGAPLEAFRQPLRLCADAALGGRRFGLRFLLQGQNLRRQTEGLLKLSFR